MSHNRYSFQFAEHCETLEQNIKNVQERAKIEAEMDDTWADVYDNDDRNVRFPLFVSVEIQSLNNWWEKL